MKIVNVEKADVRNDEIEYNVTLSIDSNAFEWLKREYGIDTAIEMIYNMEKPNIEYEIFKNMLDKKM